MDSMFNTDSGFRPPSPLTFAPPGQGLFGESLGYEDFRFPNQDFLNMPSSPGLASSSTGAPPPPPPGGHPTTAATMMNMMMMAPGGPTDPSMSLFNPSEQRYFSEFLDTLVVDQDFTFDPSAIPNLPNLPLFAQEPLTGTGGFASVENNTSIPYGMPASSSSSTSLSGLAGALAVSGPQQQQQQSQTQRHSVGTSMDFDMSSSNPYNSQQGLNSQPVSVPAKRTKTNKAISTASETTASPARKGTPANDTASFNKIATPMSKLSLNNSASQINGNGTGPSKSKKNKREQDQDDEDREDAGNNNYHHQHRSSTSSATSASSRSRSHSQSQAQSKQQPPPHLETARERNESLSDEYASDSAANGTSPNGTTPTAKRKPYKELLTEEEKRANHIASEQKRRNTIRNGFKDMTEIIPDLKDVNSSKSTILFKAVDFIRHLEKRNRILQEKANQLEARLHLQKAPSAYQSQQQHQQQFSHHQQQHQQHPYQQQQQQQVGHQLSSYRGSDRLQEIPNIYPVAISR